MEKNSIVIYNDDGCFNCEAKIKPNDIFESGNIIVTVGKNIMEIFQFSKNNDNTNDNNNKYILTKKHEININNNLQNDNIPNNNIINNNNLNDNFNNDNEILCITLAATAYIICGHGNGLMSIWKPDPNEYLKYIQSEKLHIGAINKILYAKLSDNKNYLISCSSDKTVKVYSMEDNKIVTEQKFDEEVMDVKLVKDFEKRNTFIVSLKNGVLKGLNESFQIIFDIPSRFKTNITRYVISLSNQSQDNSQSNDSTIKDNTNSNNKGDLLVITEGKILDIFTWIKEGSFKVKHPSHPNNNFRPNNPHYKGKFQNPHFFYGPQFYP